MSKSHTSEPSASEEKSAAASSSLVPGSDRERAYDQLPISLVVTDPSLPDNPIVYVNPAFTELTGYSSAASCGRNCRFLQGEDTDPATAAKIRAAVDRREPVTVDILNYRSNGEPFRNSLIVAPIVDTEAGGDNALFFMGIQGQCSPGSSDAMSEKLTAIHEHVHEQASSVLALIRNTMGDSDKPERVTSVLTSRLNALAQLYGGVFRLNASEYKDEARLGAYLARVCSATHLADRSYNTRLNTHFVECNAELRTAATVGLILSELLANAFGESNPYDSHALITVDFDWHDGVAALCVSDESARDGESLLPQEDTVGGRILDTLGRQIGIQVEEDVAGKGTRSVRVRFPTLRREELSASE